MDFNENVHVHVHEQRDRAEESRVDTFEAGEKIQQLEHDDSKDRDTVAAELSRNSLKCTNYTKLEGGRHKAKTKPRGESYAKMCEYRREESVGENLSDGSPGSFAGESDWEQRVCDPRYDDYRKGNPATEFDGNRTGGPGRNCRSGINISVVSRREAKCENVEVEKPLYSISFKCCYDKNSPRWDNKRRKSLPTSSGKSKKYSVQENGSHEKALAIQEATEETVCSQPSYRCTFENCCGNCESYLVEVPNNDCDTYKNWQNNNFETTRNTCFDDCCCPREMKVYSSNLSVRPGVSCAACVESGKCCSVTNEAKCDFVHNDCHALGKQYLQRVHFAKDEDRPKRNHSSCSFCSRKCTPSKASLFVEIGESVTDVCNLSSDQPFRCAESMESLNDCGARVQEYSGVKRNKSDSLRGKTKKRTEAKCNPSCKGRPGAVARSYSDRVACMDSRIDDCAMGQETFYPEALRNARSNVSFHEVRDCRAQTESTTRINKNTAGCNQQCETEENSLWSDIRRGKIWAQLQDTYKNFAKVASTSIGQIVKQSSKLKRSKKRTKDRLTCGTCTKECEKSVSCSNRCNQSETYNECLHEGKCWDEMMTHESNNCDTHCCRSACCGSVAGLSECQKPICQNDYRGHSQNAQEQTASQRSCCTNFCNNNHGNVRSPCGILQDLQYTNCTFTHPARKRGGGDPFNQRRKPPAPNRRPIQNPADRPNPSNCRDNSIRNQITRQQAQPLTNADQQTESATVHMDMCVQTNTVRAIVEPSGAPYIAESVAYRRRIKTVRQLDGYPGAITDSSYNESDAMPTTRDQSVIQEMDCTVTPDPSIYRRQPGRPIEPGRPRYGPPSVAPTCKWPRGGPIYRVPVQNATRDSIQRDEQVVGQDVTDGISRTSGRANQCVIIQELRVICGTTDYTQEASHVERICVCTPDSAAPTAPGTGEPRAGAEEAPLLQTGESTGLDQTLAISKAGATKDTDEEIADVTVEDEAGQEPVVVDVTEPEEKDASEQTPEERVASEQVTEDEDATAEPLIESADEREGKTAEDESGATDGKEEIPTEEEFAKETGVDATMDVSDSPIGSDSPLTVPEASDDASTITVLNAEEPGPSAAPEPADYSLADYHGTVSNLEPATDKFFGAPEMFEESTTSTVYAELPQPQTRLDKADARTPIECSGVFNGNRTHVSVEMQTSSTILTKILSEFQIGDKKRQVVMSIKLQTNMDEQPAGSEGPSGSKDDQGTSKRAESRRNTSQRDASQRDQRKHSKASSNNKSGQLKSRRQKYGQSPLARDAERRGTRSSLRDLDDIGSGMLK